MSIDLDQIRRDIDRSWRADVIDRLHDFIAIPNVSPAFDEDWAASGHMARAVELIRSWCESRTIDGMVVEVHDLPGRTPVIVCEIPATTPDRSDTVILYGHLDKQPEMSGWRDELGPWTPVLDGDRLYGRGGADDGYAVFAALTAVEALRRAGGDHARLLVLIEASEESGSSDLPAHLDALGDRLGDVSLVVGLDSGAASYDRLWVTTSLRGVLMGRLRVEVLTEGVHSGSAGGVVPSSFRILRHLLDRIEDPATGRVLVDELWCDIPEERMHQMERNAEEILGGLSFPYAGRTGPGDRSAVELLRARTWEPAIANIAVNGFPPPDRAGNVLRPATELTIAARLAPTADPAAAARALTERLTADPPLRGHGHLRRGGRRAGLERSADRALAAGRDRRSVARVLGPAGICAGRGRHHTLHGHARRTVPRGPVPHHRRARPGVQRPRPQRVPPPAHGAGDRRVGEPRARRPRPPVTGPGWAAAAADLPVGEAIEPLRRALAEHRRAVLHAPPGAGKTTIIPLALLDEPWREGTVLVLEPRRLAVRSAATRLAQLLGERPGGRVGWRMRQDTKVSARTEIEVVTEGVLTRRLQRDLELTGVSAVLFDEFHERSLDADLGLALTLEVADALRPDLRLLVMSATLDTGPVASLLDAPVIRSEGRVFPVDTVHVDADRRAAMEGPVSATVTRALAAHDGDVLVFLPGAREIDRTRRAIGDPGPGVDVRLLFGARTPAEQDAAIAPSPPGRRKVVLSTSIAETSLTIEGVTVVIDSGWRRTPRLDAGSGMTRLVTLPVTRAEADQRSGRAGRLAPGTAYRLWSRAEDATLRAHPEPEIEVADLTSLALELAAWGASEHELAFLTPPPPAHLAAARDLLQRLGALDGSGTITAHGRRMAELPLHPRLGHLLLRGAELGHAGLAAEVAAALHESGLRSRRTDVAGRLATMRDPKGRDHAAAQRARRDAARWRELVGPGGRHISAGDDAVGLLVALGYPDRIGKARPGQRGEFLLSGGRGAFVDETDPLAGAAHIAVADLDGQATRARVFLAAPLTEDDVRAVAGDDVETEDDVRWDSRRGEVVARRVERLGALALSTAPLADPPSDALRAALLDGIRQEGVGLLGWDDDTRALQARLGFLHRLDPDRWPAVDDETLVEEAVDRIGPFLGGVRRRKDLARVDVREVLLRGLHWQQRAEVDRLAPQRLRVPSGHQHRVDYSSDPPVLAVKLQELFGSDDTPTVADGRVPVVLHLLSPAGRPLQVTQDLASFWAGAYGEVRADMRGRYPKHPWPEDPTAAAPTARTKNRRG